MAEDGFLGDRADFLHGPRLDRGDVRLGVGKLLVKAGFDLLALGIGFRLGGVARLLADRVGLGLASASSCS